MNDIRILIPWDEWPYEEKGFFDRVMGEETYNEFVKHTTRPITPEDIRSCLRMPDEWTEDENARFASDIVAYEHEDIDSGELAQYAIDIATRPAPEHKPCPFCGSDIPVLKKAWYDQDAWIAYVICNECSSKGPDRISEWGAWESWDERALKIAEGK